MSNAVLKGLGHETLTVGATSVGFASIPANAARAFCIVDLADIRMSVDGSDALTTDPPIFNRSTINLMSHRFQLQDYRFIRDAGTSASLFIWYFD